MLKFEKWNFKNRIEKPLEIWLNWEFFSGVLRPYWQPLPRKLILRDEHTDAYAITVWESEEELEQSGFS